MLPPTAYSLIRRAVQPHPAASTAPRHLCNLEAGAMPALAEAG